MLAVDDVHTYYEHSHILQGVTMRAQAGAVTAILGRNGVGKTTLIRSIIGFTPPRTGSIRFGDTPIERMPSHEIARRGVGLVPQGRPGRGRSMKYTGSFRGWRIAKSTTAGSSAAASSRCSRLHVR
jgi:ABC-type cobalamin/Fe3+-siderophores transport system ATPase subunit